MSLAFLAEMAWKSTVLAVAVLGLLTIMRGHRASHRAAVAGLGLAVLALLPVAVVAVAALPVPSIDLPTPEAAVRAVPVTVEQGTALFPLAAHDLQPAAASLPTEALLAWAWATGALAVLLRLGAGLLTLRRWTGAADPVRSPKWARLLADCGAPQATALLVSDKISAPLSWGWRSPVILLSRDTLANPVEAEAVIAHEAAHLQRLDWPRLLAARLAVALFWFNPLVWMLERRHLQDVEEAADAAATCRIEPAFYAQTLLNVARGRAAPAGANSMACGSLSKRIALVLSPRTAAPSEGAWRRGALAGVVMIAAPVALTQFVPPAASAAAAAVHEAAVTTTPAPIVSTAAKAVPASIAPSTSPTPVVVNGTVAAVQAVTEATPPRALVNEEELQRILKDAEQARAHAAVAARDAEQIAAQARAQVAEQMANMRTDLLRGADDMDRGAIDMRKGAATMREEAGKLRDPAYRAEQIRKAIARGEDHVPTDQELIDAIPKMLRGADQMDAGVDKMRDGAKRMREQARRS